MKPMNVVARDERGMRVAAGADANGALTDALVAELRKRGMELAL